MKQLTHTPLRAVLFCIVMMLGLATGIRPVAAATGWNTPTHIDSSGQISFNAISCPSASFCMAADSNGSVTTFNGTTWSSPVSVGTQYGISSISCVSSSFCVASDFDGHAVVFNGTSWSAPTTYDPVSDCAKYGCIDSVSCVSTTFCMAVSGDGFSQGSAYAYNGSNWTTLTTWTNPLDTVNWLDSVSCLSTTFCVAADTSGNILTFNGTSWSAPVAVSSSSLYYVSCSTKTACVTSSNTSVYAYNGTSWSLSLSGSFFPVTCVKGTVQCMAGGTGTVYRYNGTNWTTLTTWTNPVDGSNAIQDVRVVQLDPL